MQVAWLSSLFLCEVIGGSSITKLEIAGNHALNIELRFLIASYFGSVQVQVTLARWDGIF